MEKYLLSFALLLIISQAKAEYSCTSIGTFADPEDPTCENYYVCSVLSDGNYVITPLACDSSKKFDPSLGTCSTSYVCNINSTTSTTAKTTLVDFQCTNTGRFENPNDLSCTTYYLCSKYYGTYIKTLYTCPTSANFDPDLQKCTTQHLCATATTTTPETTTTPSTTVELTTEPEMVTLLNTTEAAHTTTATTVADFDCTETGRFENSKDLSCTTYFLCSKILGMYLKTLYKCPVFTYFDPALQKCTLQHVCARSTTTTPETTTTPSTTIEITTEPEMVTMLNTTEVAQTTTATTAADFECTETGRFENPNDHTCKTYFLCSKILGMYVKTLYECPLLTHFDPALHKCTLQHVCAKTTTTKSTTTTSTTPSTTKPSTFSTTPSTTAEITTEAEMVTLLNITTEATESSTFYYDFICTTRGRYANFNDNTCKWYYLCNQLRNGTLLRTEYSCPSNSIFDQSIYKCTTLQDCASVRNSAFVVTPQFYN